MSVSFKARFIRNPKTIKKKSKFHQEFFHALGYVCGGSADCETANPINVNSEL